MKAFWQKIVAWAASKGGWAHIIALTWAFLLGAYEMVPQFHQFVVMVHQVLPGWLEMLITLAVSLWGFYKTWKPVTQQ